MDGFAQPFEHEGRIGRKSRNVAIDVGALLVRHSVSFVRKLSNQVKHNRLGEPFVYLPSVICPEAPQLHLGPQLDDFDLFKSDDDGIGAAVLTQKSLIDTQERLGAMLDVMPIGLLYTEQGILFANRAAWRPASCALEPAAGAASASTMCARATSIASASNSGLRSPVANRLSRSKRFSNWAARAVWRG